MGKFYVYTWETKRDGIFYVGKGSGNRAFRKHSNRDNAKLFFLCEKREKEKIKIKKSIVQYFDNEEEAYKQEAKLVGKYNPKCNLNAGGRGGRNPSEETRKKMSDSHKGIPLPEEVVKKIIESRSWYKHSGETKRKIGKSHGGENSVEAKLNWKQVNKIREEYVPYKMSYSKLAKLYGVSPTTIQFIIENRSWKDCNYKYVKNNIHGKLTLEEVNEIRNDFFHSGLSQKKFAKLYNVHQMTISRIINNKSFVNLAEDVVNE